MDCPFYRFAWTMTEQIRQIVCIELTNIFCTIPFIFAVAAAVFFWPMMLMTISSSLWNTNHTTSEHNVDVAPGSLLLLLHCGDINNNAEIVNAGPRHLIMNYRSARDDASTWIIWSSWICVGVSRREKRKSTRYVLRWGWFWWDVHFKCWIRMGKARWGNQEEGSGFKRAPCFHALYCWEENGREIFSSQSLKVPSISVCGWILL